MAKIGTGTHGWYVYNSCGEIVDGPFYSKREAEDMRTYYLEMWRGYYPSSSDLHVKAEPKLATFRTKGDRKWTTVLKP